MSNKRHHSQISLQMTSPLIRTHEIISIKCNKLYNFNIFDTFADNFIFSLPTDWTCKIPFNASVKIRCCFMRGDKRYISCVVGLDSKRSYVRWSKCSDELVARCETLRLTMANRQLADSIVRDKSHLLYVPITI